MTPITQARRSPLASLNPLVGFLVVLIVAVTMTISLHPLSAGIVLAAETVLVVVARLPLRRLLFRSLPLGVALLGIVAANLLFSEPNGRVLVDSPVIQITSGSLTDALTVGLRLLALALPGVVWLAGIDPTELSDALITQWHANPRIAVGSLAAVRMTPLVVADLRQSYAARRTRGLVSRNPLDATAMIVGAVTAVLVAAIRRATRLSVAMDARGFDAGLPRTLARVSRWRVRDTAVVMGSAVICVGAVACSMIIG